MVSQLENFEEPMDHKQGKAISKNVNMDSILNLNLRLAFKRF